MERLFQGFDSISNSVSNLHTNLSSLSRVSNAEPLGAVSALATFVDDYSSLLARESIQVKQRGGIATIDRTMTVRILIWSLVAIMTMPTVSSLTQVAHKTFSVAPMMQHTTRHFRHFWRLLSKDSILYTEMHPAAFVSTNGFAQDEKHAEKYREATIYSEIEDPVIYQLGGNDPEELARSVEILSEQGFYRFNLNCGCPSNVVASENAMGAAMMLKPELTAECCARMKEAAFKYNNKAEISVKCRIGVDDYDSYEFLQNFIQSVSDVGGVEYFQIHARKALLNRTCKDNRDVPPLRYDHVFRIAEDFSNLRIDINGGIESPAQAADLLRNHESLSGVMVGRACINHPYMFAEIDRELSCINRMNTASSPVRIQTRGAITEQYLRYCAIVEAAGHPQWVKQTSMLLAPMYNLFKGEVGNEKFQRTIQGMEKRGIKSARSILEHAVRQIPPDVLDSTGYRSLHDIPIYEKAKKTAHPLKMRIV